jgi:hypothetical protein
VLLCQAPRPAPTGLGCGWRHCAALCAALMRLGSRGIRGRLGCRAYAPRLAQGLHCAALCAAPMCRGSAPRLCAAAVAQGFSAVLGLRRALSCSSSYAPGLGQLHTTSNQPRPRESLRPAAQADRWSPTSLLPSRKPRRQLLVGQGEPVLSPHPQQPHTPPLLAERPHRSWLKDPTLNSPTPHRSWLKDPTLS